MAASKKSTKKTKVMAAAGATGVVGRHLIRAALDEGWEVRLFTRHPHREYSFSKEPGVTIYHWEPAKCYHELQKGRAAPHLDAVAAVLEGIDFLVNLAGSPISSGRMNPLHKKEILDSRVHTTQVLGAAANRCKRPPKVWGQASATGIYGECGEEIADESRPPGDLFLSSTGVAWEEAARESVPKKSRLFIGRISMVMADDAPAWQKMARVFRFAMGGPLGSGKQWYSWVDGDDLARAFLFLYKHGKSGEAYNLAAPHGVRQKEMAKIIGSMMRRPAFIPAPVFMLKLILGELASELLLPSCRASSEKIQKLGFRFRYDTMEKEMSRLVLDIEHEWEEED